MAQSLDTKNPLLVSYEHGAEGTRKTVPGSDLSLGGVFIETAAALPIGALLSLEIESGTTKVSLDARILSRRAADEPGRPAGVAVTFIDLPNDAAASLHHILAARMPRKGTMLGLGEAEDDIATYESARKLPAAPPSPEAAAAPVAEVPPPQVARPAPAPIPYAAAPLPAAAAAAQSWAPSPSAAPVPAKGDRTGIVFALVLVLMFAMAAAAVLIGRTFL